FTHRPRHRAARSRHGQRTLTLEPHHHYGSPGDGRRALGIAGDSLRASARARRHVLADGERQSHDPDQPRPGERSMTQPAAYAEARAGAGGLRDRVALVKPRITAMVITTTAGGLWLAPRPATLTVAAMALLGTVLIVAGANTLNMYLERDVDARMD